jgi:hypothetical protein
LVAVEAEDHGFAGGVIDLESGNPQEPQSGGVRGHEDGAVLDVDECCEDPCVLVKAEDDEEPRGMLGKEDADQDVLANEGDLVKDSEMKGGPLMITEGKRDEYAGMSRNKEGEWFSWPSAPSPR